MKKEINIPVLVVAAAVFCMLLYVPVFENSQAQQVLALLALAAILWMSEAIPLWVTGLLLPVMAVFMQLAAPRAAFAEFAHPIIFLFMGGFVLAGALSRHSLDSLLAQRLIRLAKGNFYKSAVLLMLATALISCWVSNTSSTAMMIPLALGMLVLVNKNSVTAESEFLMLGIAYSANIGGVLSLVGSPPNAIGAAILDISFSESMLYGVPIFIITFPVMIVVLTLYFKPDRKLSIGEMLVERDANAPNKTVGAIFAFTIILWILDGVLAPLLGIPDNFSSLVAVLAIVLIAVTKVLSPEEIIKSIQLEVLLLFGGGLTLGMLIDSSGLGRLLVGQVSPLIESLPLFVFLWIIVFFSIMLTEFMSNTASAALILPILFTVATQLNINPVVLVFPATIVATYGFMLPVGTPPNAIVFSSGLVPQKDMIQAGIILNLLFSVILTAFFYVIL